MEKQTLNKSKVVFDNHAHRYSIGDKVLKGVTPIIKWIYPETYADVPESVLMKAAEYGSMVHAKCEMADRVGFADPDCPAVLQYQTLKDENNLDVFDNEYLVNYGEELASSIDVVCYDEKNDVWPLADIKTTSKIHVPNVTLQLSIYAYMFELCNDGKKAGDIMCIWLPKPQYGKPKVMKLKRIPMAVCREIIEGYLMGLDYTVIRNKYADILGAISPASSTDVAVAEERLPDTYAQIEHSLIVFETRIKEYQQKEKEMKEYLLKAMQDHNVKKWQTERIQIVRKAASVRVTVDSAKLKKNFAEVYEQCKKESKTAESLQIKIL